MRLVRDRIIAEEDEGEPYGYGCSSGGTARPGRVPDSYAAHRR